MAETLRELVVALSLDSSNFSRNMRTINAQIKEAESTFSLAGAGVENFEKTIAGTEAKLSMLRNKLTQQNRAVEQYSRALVAANDKLKENYNRHQDYSQRLEQAKERQEALRFEVETATFAEDIAEVMSIAGQLGIENEHLAEFARIMIDLGIVNNMIMKQKTRLDAAAKAMEESKARLEAEKNQKRSNKIQVDEILTWASRFEDASYEVKHMVITELVDRIEVKKDYEITIYWRMTADQFLGKKTEASA